MELRSPYDRKDGQRDLVVLAHALTASAPAREDFGQWTRIPYEPRKLCSRKIILSDETQGAISKLEITAARYDCLIGASDYRSSLRRLMHRLEGVFSWRLNGVDVDYRLCCCVDHFATAGALAEQADPQQAVKRMVGAEGESVRAAVGAHQIETIIDGVFAGELETAGLTPARIVAIHDAIAGTLHPSQACGLRTWELPPVATARDGSAYLAPPPQALPAFLGDVAAFIATSKLGPVAKSALAYFQLETARMFSSSIDEAGRVIAACLWKQEGLIEHMMPPISITPALEAGTHAKKLRFYLADPGSCELLMLDDWVYLIACSTLNAFEVEWACFQRAQELVASWEDVLVERGAKVSDQLARLLVELVGTPIFSISSMGQAVGASFSTTSAMVERLMRAGIVEQINEGKRNRIFECPDAVGLCAWVDRAFREAKQRA